MAGPEPRPTRVDILGCPFDVVSHAETVEHLRQAVINNHRVVCATGNIDMVMRTRRDPDFREEYWRSDLVVADGVPIVWAAALLGTPLRGRVNGTELVLSCAQISADTGCAIALIGGEFAVTEKAAQKMTERFPGSKLYALPTPFPLDDAANAVLVDAIQSKNAKIVLVALGAPKQERWIRGNLERCGANVGIGIGSAFDIISGNKVRAPRLLRENGLEWLWRLVQEPKRLGRRYLIEDMPFIWHFLAELVRRRILGRRPSTTGSGRSPL